MTKHARDARDAKGARGATVGDRGVKGWLIAALSALGIPVGGWAAVTAYDYVTDTRASVIELAAGLQVHINTDAVRWDELTKRLDRIEDGQKEIRSDVKILLQGKGR